MLLHLYIREAFGRADLAPTTELLKKGTRKGRPYNITPENNPTFVSRFLWRGDSWQVPCGSCGVTEPDWYLPVTK